MASFYPQATVKNIPPGENDPPIVPRIACLHVDAGNAESLYEFFRDRSGGIESHFFIKKTGEVEQYRDTDWQADANLDANDFCVSIETQGYGEGEWTDEQLASIKALLLWLHDQYPAITLEVCTAWDGRGIGYHTMWGSPSHWTPVAKTCPGPDRIKQFNNIIVPWLEAGAPEGDDMSAQDVKDIKAAVAADGKQTRDVVRELAKAERERDAKKQSALLAAVAEIEVPPGAPPEAYQAAFEQAVRDVFADAASPE